MINKTAINYLLVLFFTLLTLTLIRVFNIGYPLFITSTTKTSELAVVGEGKVDVGPDTAYIDVGVTINNATTVAEAQNNINTVNNNLIKQMRGLGVNKEDIKTSNYSIYPNYVYEGGQNKISGYNGNVSINIKIKNIQLASKIVEVATVAGANQINGIAFTIDKPEKYREEARNEAIKNAKDQAEKLAKSLGIKLGPIVNIIESSANTTLPAMSKNYMGGGGAEGPSFEGGTQTITSVVTLYFEKK